MGRRCTRCGAEFSCGMDADPGGACWCMALPRLAAVPQPAAIVDAGADVDAGCWCRACLEQHIAQRPGTSSGTQPA
jgi:hypothetical protein